MNVKDIARMGTRIFNIAFWLILAYLAGDVGMGFYFTAFVVFYLLSSVMTEGTKQAVARMVTVRRSKGLHHNSRLVFKYAFLLSLLYGGLCAFVLWFFSGSFFESLIGYRLPESVLAVFGLYFVIYNVKSVIYGYFMGKGDTLVCIAAELIRCLILVSLGPVLIIRMYGYGIKVSALLGNPLYANLNGAIGAVITQAIGAVVCIIVIIIGDRIAGMVDREVYNSVKGVDNGRSITLSLIKADALYLVSKGLFSVVLFAACVIYLRFAHATGTDVKEAFLMLGAFAGKFLPIIGFVMIFYTEYNERECKKIRQDVSSEEHKTANLRIEYLIKNTIYMLLPIALFVIIMAGPIAAILYSGRISYGAVLIRRGGILILFIGLSVMCKGILTSIRINLLSFAGPLLGLIVVLGSLIVMCASGNADALNIVNALILGYLTDSLISFLIVCRYVGPDLIDIGFKCGKIAAGALIYAGIIAILDNFIVMNIIYVIIALIIAYGGYIVTIAVLKGIDRRDINSLKGTLMYYPTFFIGGIFANR